jgi:hypothetical protein
MSERLTPAVQLPTSDFSLSPSEFQRLRDGARARVSRSRRPSASSSAGAWRDACALRIETFREYIGLLERGEGSELEEFINAVTTN